MVRRRVGVKPQVRVAFLGRAGVLAASLERLAWRAVLRGFSGRWSVPGRCLVIAANFGRLRPNRHAATPPHPFGNPAQAALASAAVGTPRRGRPLLLTTTLLAWAGPRVSQRVKVRLVPVALPSRR